MITPVELGFAAARPSSAGPSPTAAASGRTVPALPILARVVCPPAVSLAPER